MRVVDDVFSSTAGHLNVQHARLVSAVVWMLDNARESQGDGLWTPEAYVRWRTGVSQATASKIVAVAKRAVEFPHCIETMQRGELSLDQIAPVAKHAPAWCDQQMSGLAPRLTGAQVTKTAREYPWDDDLSTAGQAAKAEAETGDSENPDDSDSIQTEPTPTAPADEAWYGWDDNGRFRLHANLGADSGSIVEAALTEAHDNLFNTGTPDVDTADALIEAAERSLDTIESPERRNRYRLNFHMDDTGQVTDNRQRPVAKPAAQRITATRCSRPSSSSTASRSRSVVRNTSSPTGLAVRSNTATQAAESPDARVIGSSKSTTSFTGPTTARPTRSTSSVCVPNTTDFITKDDWESGATPTTRTGSNSPTSTAEFSPNPEQDPGPREHRHHPSPGHTNTPSVNASTSAGSFSATTRKNTPDTARFKRRRGSSNDDASTEDAA